MTTQKNTQKNTQKTSKKNMNTGISESQRKIIADGLAIFLADTYTLYLKTHNFHWNVTGPYFQTLHLLFETQYTELSLAVDLIAERIRALGFPAPGSYQQFSKLSKIKEETSVPESSQMLEQLMSDHEYLSKSARELFLISDKAQDEVTNSLLSDRMDIHEKTAWMLRSSLA